MANTGLLDHLYDAASKNPLIIPKGVSMDPRSEDFVLKLQGHKKESFLQGIDEQAEHVQTRFLNENSSKEMQNTDARFAEILKKHNNDIEAIIIKYSVFLNDLQNKAENNLIKIHSDEGKTGLAAVQTDRKTSKRI